MKKTMNILYLRKIPTKLLVWIGLPLFFLIVMELTARMRFGNPSVQQFWYKGAEDTVSSSKIDYIFIGSSRVAAAIHPISFLEVLFPHQKRPLTALNLGRGYSTMAQHFLGLRNMLSVAPQNLQSTTIFISTETGLPPHDTWKTKWEHPVHPLMIIPLLKLSDVIRLWQITGLPLEEKLNLTKLYFNKVSVALSNRELIRARFLQEGTQSSINLLMKTGVISSGENVKPITDDLTTAGGIRNDVDGVTQARSLAIKLAQSDMENEQPIRNWEQSILAELVEIVTKNGGKVIFFDTPISSVQARPMQTSLRREDRKIFEQQVRVWCSTILRPNFVYRDLDIPDLWHLKLSLAPEFTASLAEEYIQYLNSFNSDNSIKSCE